MDGALRTRWVTIFLDFPADGFDAGVAFWQEVTGSELSAFRGEDGQFATLLPPYGDPWLRVQRLASGPGGCHLDLHIDISAQSLDGAAAEAVRLGASVRYREDGLVITASPGGFPFCFVEWHGEARQPAPVMAGPGEGGPGPASLVDQLCLDAPPGDFDREVEFWAALLGLTPRGVGEHPEFCYAGLREGCVRLLVQRRDEAAPGDNVHGHVDIASTDRAEMTRRHVAVGARVVAELPWWTVLADPARREYCLVGREPGQPPRS